MKSLSLTNGHRASRAIAAFLICSACATCAQGSLIITGVMEPPTSDEPRIVELYALADADRSVYRLDRYDNGSNTVTATFFLGSGTVLAGNFFYAVDGATSQTELDTWFGAGVVNLGTNAISGTLTIDGRDALRLRQGSSTTRDLFGDIGTDGNGQPWEYSDGWAYRKDGTVGDTTSFTIANWTFSGPQALDPASTNNGGSGFNGSDGTPAFPIGTYSETAAASAPEPGSLLLASLAGLLLLLYHRYSSSRVHGNSRAAVP